MLCLTKGANMFHYGQKFTGSYWQLFRFPHCRLWDLYHLLTMTFFMYLSHLPIRWFGRFIFILVLIQIELGLRLFSEVTMGMYIAYYVYISTILGIFLGFSFYRWLYWRRKSKSSGYEFDDSRNFVKMDETGSVHD